MTHLEGVPSRYRWRPLTSPITSYHPTSATIQSHIEYRQTDLTQARHREEHPYPLLTRIIPLLAVPDIHPSYVVLQGRSQVRPQLAHMSPEYGGIYSDQSAGWDQMVAIFSTVLVRVVNTVGGVLTVVTTSVGNWVLWRFWRKKWPWRRKKNPRTGSNWKARNPCMGSIHNIYRWTLRPPNPAPAPALSSRGLYSHFKHSTASVRYEGWILNIEISC